MSVRAPFLAAAAAAAVLHGCACDSVPDTALTACEMTRVVPGPVKTDVLFVIDDSGSMSQEQTNLQTNLNTFISTLKSSPIANDFQIGVTTTSVEGFDGTTGGYQQGKLIYNVPTGTPAVLDGNRADLVNEFSTRVVVGTGGSGKEQPFRAMELALSPALLDNVNLGFLRSGSRLAVVFLTDEDDCSDSATPKGITDTTTNGGNNQCHNDAGDGVDYKFTKIDTIDHYESFLKGAIGPTGAQEVRDVVLAGIIAVDPVLKEPTCGNTGNSWCCGGALNSTSCSTSATSCASYEHTVTSGSNSVVGATYCCGGTAGACTSTCSTAYDKADRFERLFSRFPAKATLMGSVCDASFAQTLEQIAGLIVSQTVPLDGAPADYRLLVVGVRHADGSYDSCSVQPAGSPGAASAGAVYVAPTGGAPATLTFQNACALGRGDQLQIDVVCAG